jgi:hypothetical protein
MMAYNATTATLIVTGENITNGSDERYIWVLSSKDGSSTRHSAIFPALLLVALTFATVKNRIVWDDAYVAAIEQNALTGQVFVIAHNVTSDSVGLYEVCMSHHHAQ